MADLGQLYFSILYKDDPQQLEKIRKRALEQLKDIEVKLNVRGSTASKKGTSVSSMSKEEMGYIEQLIQRTKELEQQYKSLPKAADATPIIKQFSEVKRELDDVGKNLVDASKKQNLAEGSLVAYRAELSKLIYEYDRLSATEREAAAGKALLEKIQRTTIELNNAEQASMRYRRNVGNYKSGFNGLTFQVQQLARELPSIAYGANIFFAAISNNLPMFNDELRRAKKEYADLKKEHAAGLNLNKKAVPVWKQVASSIFSWQTALVAVITVLTLYGAKIVSAIGNMLKFGNAAKLTRSEIKELGKSFADVAGQEIAKLDILFDNLKKAKEGTDEWNDARIQILKQHGEVLSSMNAEIATLEDQAGAYRKLRDEIYKTAREKAIEKFTEKAQEKAIKEATIGYDKIYDEAVSKRGEQFADDFIDRLRKDIETTGKLSAELEKEISDIFTTTRRVTKTDASGYTYEEEQRVNDVESTVNKILKAEETLRKRRAAAESVYDWLNIDDEEIKQDKAYWDTQRGILQQRLDALTKEEALSEKGLKLKQEIKKIEEDIEAAYGTKEDERAKKSKKANDPLKERVALLMEANSLYEKWLRISGSDKAENVVKAIYPEFDPDTLRSDLEKIRKTGSMDARIEAAKALTGLDEQSVETTLKDVERQITETVAKWDLFYKLYKESGDYDFSIKAAFGGKTGFKSVLEQLQREIEDEIKGNKQGISFAELIKADLDTVAKTFGGKTSLLVEAYQEESKKLSEESLMRAAELLSNYRNYEQKRKQILAKGEEDTAALIANGASQDAIDEVGKRTQQSLKDLQKEVLDLYGLGNYAEDGNVSDYFKDAIKNALPLFKSVNTATIAELKKAKDVISSMKVPPQLLADFEAAGGDAKALADMIKLAQESANKAIDDRLFENLVNSINKMVNSVGKLGAALQKLNNGALKSSGEFLSSISEGMGSILSIMKLGKNDEATTWDYISTALSGVEMIVSAIGTNIEKNKIAQKEWNDAIADGVQQMRLYNIERLAYERGSIFGMDNPMKPAIAAMEQLWAARKELLQLEKELGEGKVQIGTKRVASGSAFGSIIGGGAAIGAAVGSFIPVIGTAIGAAAGAVIGALVSGISALFGSKATTKLKPVYESLKKNYSYLYDPETYELNPKILADYKKLDDATKKIVDNWDAIKQKMDEADKQVEETLSSIAGSIGEDLYNTLIDAFTNDDLKGALNEFKTDVNKMLSELATRILFSSLFSELLTDAEERMKKSLSQEGDQNLMDDIDWLGEQLEKGIPTFLEGLEGIDKMLESLGRDLSFGVEGRSDMKAGIKALTEDTGSLLASYINSIRADIAMHLDLAKKLVDSNIPEITAVGKAQLIQLQTISRNTERAAIIAEDMMNFLNSVSAGTKALKVK